MRKTTAENRALKEKLNDELEELRQARFTIRGFLFKFSVRKCVALLVQLVHCSLLQQPWPHVTVSNSQPCMSDYAIGNASTALTMRTDPAFQNNSV